MRAGLYCNDFSIHFFWGWMCAQDICGKPLLVIQLGRHRDIAFGRAITGMSLVCGTPRWVNVCGSLHKALERERKRREREYRERAGEKRRTAFEAIPPPKRRWTWGQIKAAFQEAVKKEWPE